VAADIGQESGDDKTNDKNNVSSGNDVMKFNKNNGGSETCGQEQLPSVEQRHEKSTSDSGLEDLLRQVIRLSAKQSV